MGGGGGLQGVVARGRGRLRHTEGSQSEPYSDLWGGVTIAGMDPLREGRRLTQGHTDSLDRPQSSSWAVLLSPPACVELHGGEGRRNLVPAASVTAHTVALLQIPASLLMTDGGCGAGLGSQHGLCSFPPGVPVPHTSFPGGYCSSHGGSHTQGTVLPGQAVSPCDDGVGLRSWLL